MQELYIKRLSTFHSDLKDVLDETRAAGTRRLATTFTAGKFETADETLLLQFVVFRIWNEWENICPGTPCPISFSEEERADNIENGTMRNGLLDILEERGIPYVREGWVWVGDFEEEREKVKKFLRELVNAYRENEEGKRRILGHVRSWKVTGREEGWVE